MTNYKTQYCKNLWLKGSCTYGERCNFKHGGHVAGQPLPEGGEWGEEQGEEEGLAELLEGSSLGLDLRPPPLYQGGRGGYGSARTPVSSGSYAPVQTGAGFGGPIAPARTPVSSGNYGPLPGLPPGARSPVHSGHPHLGWGAQAVGTVPPARSPVHSGSYAPLPQGATPYSQQSQGGAFLPLPLQLQVAAGVAPARTPVHSGSYAPLPQGATPFSQQSQGGAFLPLPLQLQVAAGVAPARTPMHSGSYAPLPPGYPFGPPMMQGVGSIAPARTPVSSGNLGGGMGSAYPLPPGMAPPRTPVLSIGWASIGASSDRRSMDTVLLPGASSGSGLDGAWASRPASGRTQGRALSGDWGGGEEGAGGGGGLRGASATAPSAGIGHVFAVEFGTAPLPRDAPLPVTGEGQGVVGGLGRRDSSGSQETLDGGWRRAREAARGVLDDGGTS
jgi:hypothetical protein